MVFIAGLWYTIDDMGVSDGKSSPPPGRLGVGLSGVEEGAVRLRLVDVEAAEGTAEGARA